MFRRLTQALRVLALEHAGVTGARFAELTEPPPQKQRRKARRKSPRLT